MRRVRTQDDRDDSVNSQTKRKLTRQELKKIKLDKMRYRFNQVFKKIQQLKMGNNQDILKLNDLKVNSERIERIAINSMRKARKISESLDKRYSLPFGSRRQSWDGKYQSQPFNIEEAEQKTSTNIEKICQNSQESKIQQIFETVEIQQSLIGFSRNTSKQPQILKKTGIIDSEISKTIKNSKIHIKQNRFQLEIKRQQPNKKFQHSQRNKKTVPRNSYSPKSKVSQSICPYICVIIFSTLVLCAIFY